ncbi:MAG: biotin--[acetyl-CoA-carboxylase] ligase [Clostridiales bacterium]|jgi:BirA family biotin operon repressor/biotin-[acetyl-CoA-carboxylase] ligase|nr:biotin--[acetyl-CoA-carboxylase] ligase [Clostridiales bacterium]
MSAKEKILEILEENRGGYVSGEFLAAQVQISRAAVWKAITALRGQGYDIQGVTKLGYALAEDTDRLTAAGIGACLSPVLREQLSILSYETLDSTNNEAKRLLTADGLDDGKMLLITAEQQTAGRGRLGRSFYSPLGTGIYMSFVFTASASLADAVGITGAAAVSVVQAIRRLTGKEPQIKWVNDIFLEGKKICGILTEAVTSLENSRAQQIVVGIGINCATADFPKEVAAVAGSLGADSVRRCALCAAVVEALCGFIGQLGERSWMEEYRAASLVLGREILCIQGENTFLAVAEAIDDDGGLVVRCTDGSSKTLHSGEISVRLTGK